MLAEEDNHVVFISQFPKSIYLSFLTCLELTLKTSSRKWEGRKQRFLVVAG